jgi:hypothetical protein
MSVLKVREAAFAGTQIETIAHEIRRQPTVMNPSRVSSCELTARHRCGQGFADLP